MVTRLFQTIVLLAVVSFVLHLVWESVHVRFYTGYEDSSYYFPVYVWAAVGDVLYTLGAFALVSAFKQSIDWIQAVTITDYLGFVAVGFFVALMVEYKAIALHRWEYLPLMPILPILKVGITPLLQMSLLLPLSLYIVSWLERKIRSDIVST